MLNSDSDDVNNEPAKKKGCKYRQIQKECNPKIHSSRNPSYSGKEIQCKCNKLTNMCVK